MDPFKYQIKMTDVMNMGLAAAGSKQAKVPRKAAGLLLFKAEQKKFQREEKAAAQKNAAAKLFLTQPEVTREASLLKLTTPTPPPEDDLELEEPERKKLDIDDIKKRLYQRECTKLGITPVGAFMREPTKTELAIRHYGLGRRGVKALSVPLMLDSTLTSLDLEGNAIGADGLAEMVEMLSDNCSITHLNLKRNKLCARGAILIVKVMLSNRHIVSLNLSANDLDDKDGTRIAEMVKESKTLKTLDLSDNSLGFMSGEALGEALVNNDHIESLDVSWNKFREAGAAKLLKGVMENISLRTLSLAYNACGRSSCKDPPDILGPLLAGNEFLNSLDISANRLTDQDFVKLSRGVLANEALTSLKVGQNLITTGGTALLVKSALSNENSKLIHMDMTDCPVTEEDLKDVKGLRERGCEVIHGLVLQKEADLRHEPKPNKKKEAEILEEPREMKVRITEPTKDNDNKLNFVKSDVTSDSKVDNDDNSIEDDGSRTYRKDTNSNNGGDTTVTSTAIEETSPEIPPAEKKSVGFSEPEVTDTDNVEQS